MGGRFTTVVVCNLNLDCERERFLKSVLMNYFRTPWVASVDYSEVSTIKDRFHPYLVLLDLGKSPEQAIALIPLVKRQTIEYVIVIASPERKDLMPRIVEHGVTDILPGNNIQSELEAAVENISNSRNK